MTQVRRVSVFGATGSIGQNTLDLIARDSGSYDVVALTGGRNVALLAQDAKRLLSRCSLPAPPLPISFFRSGSRFFWDSHQRM